MLNQFFDCNVWGEIVSLSSCGPWTCRQLQYVEMDGKWLVTAAEKLIWFPVMIHLKAFSFHILLFLSFLSRCQSLWSLKAQGLSKKHSLRVVVKWIKNPVWVYKDYTNDNINQGKICKKWNPVLTTELSESFPGSRFSVCLPVWKKGQTAGWGCPMLACKTEFKTHSMLTVYLYMHVWHTSGLQHIIRQSRLCFGESWVTRDRRASRCLFCCACVCVCGEGKGPFYYYGVVAVHLLRLSGAADTCRDIFFFVFFFGHDFFSLLQCHFVWFTFTSNSSRMLQSNEMLQDLHCVLVLFLFIRLPSVFAVGFIQ